MKQSRVTPHQFYHLNKGFRNPAGTRLDSLAWSGRLSLFALDNLEYILLLQSRAWSINKLVEGLQSTGYPVQFKIQSIFSSRPFDLFQTKTDNKCLWKSLVTTSYNQLHNSRCSYTTPAVVTQFQMYLHNSSSQTSPRFQGRSSAAGSGREQWGKRMNLTKGDWREC